MVLQNINYKDSRCNQYTREQVMKTGRVLEQRVQPINQKKKSSPIKAERFSHTGKFSIIQQRGG
jgi:hypothetical protein